MFVFVFHFLFFMEGLSLTLAPLRYLCWTCGVCMCVLETTRANDVSSAWKVGDANRQTKCCRTCQCRTDTPFYGIH